MTSLRVRLPQVQTEEEAKAFLKRIIEADLALTVVRQLMDAKALADIILEEKS